MLRDKAEKEKTASTKEPAPQPVVLVWGGEVPDSVSVLKVQTEFTDGFDT